MKILVGYDGSSASRKALELGAIHANAFKGKIHIATSIMGNDGNDVKRIRVAEKGLDFAKQLLAEKGVESETHLLIRGLSPGEDLVRFAKDNGVIGIIVGVKHTSRVGKAIFGSNAQYIILNAPCPVTTLR